MNDPTIEVNIAEVLKDLQSGQKEVLKEISTIKIGSEEIKGEIKTVKIDLTWIKWLFGGLLSFILLLLSIILTVLFKLIN